MKKSIIIVIATVCLPLSAQVASPLHQMDEQGEILSLQQVLDSARQNNIAIRHAQQSIDAAVEQRKEAFTKYFPNVSGTGLWFNANKGMAEITINPQK